MIEARWDVETQKQGNGEREFMANFLGKDPPTEVGRPVNLEGWEKK